MKELVLDVAHWDEGIDLAAWKKKHKLWGVIIKAGGNETRLGRYKDRCFENFYKQATKAGLHIGAYYYTVSTSTADAKKDAEHFISLLSGKKFDMPIYMDVEDSRQFALSKDALTKVITTFCDIVNAKGYYAGLYMSGSAWLNNVNTDKLRKYANWIAWWRKNWPTEAGDIGLWQQGTMRYSDGDIKFADESGYHDCSWCCIDYPAKISGSSKKTNTTPSTKPATTNQNESKKNTNGTADDVIKVAEGELGYYALNDPKAGSKYGRWMSELMNLAWLAGPSTITWWCCMFVSWCLYKAGVKCDGFPSYNTDTAVSKAQKLLVKDKNQIRRGDILIFDWNWATNATDHIGFAKGSPVNGKVTTIEGNVGNAVQNKVRDLGTIRYVIRPPYGKSSGGDSTSNKSNAAPNNKNGGKLVVDGVGGYNTILDWQNQLGTPCDGEITGQVFSNRQYFPGITNVTWEGTGSTLVRAIQKKVGAEADGYWGRDTSLAVQKFLIKKGYSVGSAGADRIFGTDSVKALQRSLNDGVWKK